MGQRKVQGYRLYAAGEGVMRHIEGWEVTELLDLETAIIIRGDIPPEVQSQIGTRLNLASGRLVLFAPPGVDILKAVPTGATRLEKLMAIASAAADAARPILSVGEKVESIERLRRLLVEQGFLPEPKTVQKEVQPDCPQCKTNAEVVSLGSDRKHCRTCDLAWDPSLIDLFIKDGELVLPEVQIGGQAEGQEEPAE